MDEICFVEFCKLPVCHACLCGDFPVFFCQNHENDHRSQFLDKDHHIISAFIGVSDDSKVKFLTSLIELIRETEVVISQALDLVSDEGLNDYFLLLMNFSANLQFIKTKLQETGRILPFHANSNTFRQLITPEAGTCEAYLQAMQSYLTENHHHLLLRLQREPTVGPLEELVLAEQADNKKFIYFLKQSGRILVKFNVFTHEAIEMPLQLRYNDISAPIMCQISNSLLFLHGGRNFDMEFFGFTFLINTNSMSYVRLPEGVIRGSATGLLHDWKIFIFGGYLRTSYRGVKLRTSNYFDLRMNVWRQLSDLPEPQYGTSACLIGNSILLTGRKHNFLQLYSITQDTFRNLNAKVEFGMVNILIKYKENVALVTSSNIYQASIADLTKWKIVSKCTKGLANSLNYDVAFEGKYAYFSDCYGFIFQFDCEEASVKVIKKID